MAISTSDMADGVLGGSRVVDRACRTHVVLKKGQGLFAGDVAMGVMSQRSTSPLGLLMQHKCLILVRSDADRACWDPRI